MQTYSIIIIRGDGIGPEIVDASLDLLETVQTSTKRFKLDYDFHEAGAEYYLKTGEVISTATIDAIGKADATIKGPSGLPHVRKPDGTEAGSLGGVLRMGFDLFANVRPVRLLPNVPTPLANRKPGDIDYIFVRENTQGLYLSRGVGIVTADAASDSMMLTRNGCERIVRYAFKLAQQKREGAPADQRQRVTLIDKSNVLRSFAFFKDIFYQVAREFSDIEAENLYVDAASAALVNRPQHFHVLVTENMFGDILSDLGAATIGGLGMCAGANIGESVAYFEPIHGTAPDIVGQNLANPLSQIRAAAMMLDYLGESEVAQTIEKAIWHMLQNRSIVFTPTGGVEGGGSVLVEQLKQSFVEVAANL